MRFRNLLKTSVWCWNISYLQLFVSIRISCESLNIAWICQYICFISPPSSISARLLLVDLLSVWFQEVDDKFWLDWAFNMSCWHQSFNTSKLPSLKYCLIVATSLLDLPFTSVSVKSLLLLNSKIDKVRCLLHLIYVLPIFPFEILGIFTELPDSDLTNRVLGYICLYFYPSVDDIKYNRYFLVSSLFTSYEYRFNKFQIMIDHLPRIRRNFEGSSIILCGSVPRI